ncbi:TPA: hypothetical protein DIC20_02500 [Candidatus Dependentiae bacterium]|nr:MAG: Ankyrin [candidate division TM6 bacterium GW2011_GWF2_36_131]KKQ03376.1 MAG: Ankyrin [candidate division TM6 bacterium GW2011_GWE2_36_25]KKQ18943.1 MAG: Ankyrin [candidate division TM6 bacterium GW2011_GWA2_36_9]HBR70846.1 hypothetical protein [Candidatus Dependentiae bacterium]HCU00551.1 hypothetical protein [Candidatus Dependentiae bacterium]
MKFEVIIFLLLFSTVLLGDSYNKLVNAIRHNNYNSVQKVLEENVDVNKTKWGVTPLYIAVHFDRCEMILPLIKKGADINVVMGSKKRTPLHKAVSKGNVSIVRVLVEAGADVTIPNKYGKTAIEEAQESGYEEIVQILANQH